jgi:hypothetical protein
MTVLTDADLYLRGAETLLASWEQYARGATGAAVQRSRGVAAAVFPNEPERAVYNNANNALPQRDLAAAQRTDALDAMEAAYAAAGVTRFAAWMHERDEAMRRDLERRGYALEESTRGDGHGARRRPPAQAGDRARATGLVRVPAHPRGAAGPAQWGRSRRLPRPGRTPWWRERRGRDGVRPRRPDWFRPCRGRPAW